MAKSVKKLQPLKEKKSAVKKTSKKDKLREEEDDFNKPVWVDPEKQKPFERPLIDPPEDEASKKDAPKPLGSEIQKAKLKNELFLEVEYSETIKDGTNTVKKDCTAPVHDDLKKAFAKLDIHLSGRSEQFTVDGQLDTVFCKGFSIGNDGGGVKLYGYRSLSNGKPFNFLSPYCKWDDEADYEGADNLRGAVNVARSEVKKYLFEGKHQPDIQGKLNL